MSVHTDCPSRYTKAVHLIIYKEKTATPFRQAYRACVTSSLYMVFAFIHLKNKSYSTFKNRALKNVSKFFKSIQVTY